MMVPTTDYNNLINYYKGRLTESALLDKASRLAAERHMTLKDPKVSTSVALAMSKPKALDVQRLTRRLRTGGLGSVNPTRHPLNDEDDMLKTPLDSKLDKILRNTKRRNNEREVDWIDLETPAKKKQSVVKVKRKSLKAKLKGGWTKAIRQGALKGLAKKWGVSVSDGDVPKGTSEPQSPTKKKRKTTPRAVRDLRPAVGKISPKVKNRDARFYPSMPTRRRQKRTTRTTRSTKRKTTTRRRRRRRLQRGGGIDVQKWLGKTGMEFHWPGYQFMGPRYASQKASGAR